MSEKDYEIKPRYDPLHGLEKVYLLRYGCVVDMQAASHDHLAFNHDEPDDFDDNDFEENYEEYEHDDYDDEDEYEDDQDRPDDFNYFEDQDLPFDEDYSDFDTGDY